MCGRLYGLPMITKDLHGGKWKLKLCEKDDVWMMCDDQYRASRRHEKWIMNLGTITLLPLDRWCSSCIVFCPGSASGLHCASTCTRIAPVGKIVDGVFDRSAVLYISISSVPCVQAISYLFNVADSIWWYVVEALIASSPTDSLIMPPTQYYWVFTYMGCGCLMSLPNRGHTIPSSYPWLLTPVEPI